MKPRTKWSLMALAGGVVAGMTLPHAQDIPNPVQDIGPVKMSSYDYDMDKVVLPPDFTYTELEGRHLFMLRCAACHTGAANSFAPRLDEARLQALGDDAVRTKIAMGSRRMPGFRYMFEEPQVDQIIAYLKAITPDENP